MEKIKTVDTVRENYTLKEQKRNYINSINNNNNIIINIGNCNNKCGKRRKLICTCK